MKIIFYEGVLIYTYKVLAAHNIPIQTTDIFHDQNRLSHPTEFAKEKSIQIQSSGL
jgi:hypothetical protein